MKFKFLFLIFLIIFINDQLYAGNDSGHFFIKGTTGINPLWTVGLAPYVDGLGIEISFSTSDGGNFVNHWNNRYGDDSGASTTMIDINVLFGINDDSKNISIAEKGDLSLYVGAGLTATKAEAEIPIIDDTKLEGRVYAFNAFLNGLYCFSESIFVEFRVGYRIFGSLKIEGKYMDNGSEYTYKTKIPGSDLNDYSVSIGLCISP